MNDDYVFFVWLMASVLAVGYVLIVLADKFLGKETSIQRTQRECDELIAQANQKLRARERIKTNTVFETHRKGDL